MAMDFRSDTVTRPTAAMRAAMAEQASAACESLDRECVSMEEMVASLRLPANAEPASDPASTARRENSRPVMRHLP